MSKKQYIGIIILTVMILGFLFYWYEFRPSQIKKWCFIEAQEEAIKLLKTKAEILEKYKEGAERDLYLEDDFEYYYKNCLRKKGL
ncbi:hypothetical protein B6D52_02750 [Candidatus Parcubacteria bacterium 4484_255]|nr:MAG: hypothetical protein B6D52_02750 [Candidatus Parcubacteria bacterium 4484_255]